MTIYKTLIYAITLTLLSFSAIATQAQQPYALLIGVSNYRFDPLANPAKDATAIEKKLKAYNWETSLITNPTARKIKNELAKINRLRRQNKHRPVLIYYSGHGAEFNGENLLFGKDFIGDFKRGSGVVTLSDIMTTVTTGNGINFLMLDACRSNPFANYTAGVRLGLGKVDAPQNTFISYATAPGKYAYDGDSNDGSPYRKAFLNRLTETQDISSMFIKIRADVIATTNGSQVPWESTSLLETFSFKPTTSLEEELEISESFIPIIPAATPIDYERQQKIELVDFYQEKLLATIEQAPLSAFHQTEYGTHLDNHLLKEYYRQSLQGDFKQRTEVNKAWMLARIFIDGYLNPSCRANSSKLTKLDFDCRNSDEWLTFTPVYVGAFDLATYAFDNGERSDLLGEMYQNGYYVDVDLIKAYDLFYAGKSVDPYYEVNINQMAQELINGKGHNLRVDGDFGPSSCNAMMSLIGDNQICGRIPTREQFEALVKVSSNQLN
ncbi:caspase family protein [Endozoicomonas euniceicola]|uniref:Caspase family protein n=1 Tax=Endozoicomonas euniceicola TaxID=1234143 RepID=A0ABY6GUA1_9GAMM|nr:caspase family protein [Endozoicomonas euniceicola]UYM16334.1 caspase family protein [Endozoicomonas euniceicola]